MSHRSQHCCAVTMNQVSCVCHCLLVKQPLCLGITSSNLLWKRDLIFKPFFVLIDLGYIWTVLVACTVEHVQIRIHINNTAFIVTWKLIILILCWFL